MKTVEVRTIKKVNPHSIHFRETPQLSAHKRWFPNAREGQKWRLTVDYSAHPTGKVVAAELVGGAG